MRYELDEAAAREWLASIIDGEEPELRGFGTHYMPLSWQPGDVEVTTGLIELAQKEGVLMDLDPEPSKQNEPYPTLFAVFNLDPHGPPSYRWMVVITDDMTVTSEALDIRDIAGGRSEALRGIDGAIAILEEAAQAGSRLQAAADEWKEGR